MSWVFTILLGLIQLLPLAVEIVDLFPSYCHSKQNSKGSSFFCLWPQKLFRKQLWSSFIQTFFCLVHRKVRLCKKSKWAKRGFFKTCKLLGGNKDMLGQSKRWPHYGHYLWKWCKKNGLNQISFDSQLKLESVKILILWSHYCKIIRGFYFTEKFFLEWGII